MSSPDQVLIKNARTGIYPATSSTPNQEMVSHGNRDIGGAAAGVSTDVPIVIYDSRAHPLTLRDGILRSGSMVPADAVRTPPHRTVYAVCCAAPSPSTTI